TLQAFAPVRPGGGPPLSPPGIPPRLKHVQWLEVQRPQSLAGGSDVARNLCAPNQPSPAVGRQEPGDRRALVHGVFAIERDDAVAVERKPGGAPAREPGRQSFGHGQPRKCSGRKRKRPPSAAPATRRPAPIRPPPSCLWAALRRCSRPSAAG